MYRKQRGFNMMAVAAIAVLVVIVALLGMKIAPAYIEYGAIKKAVTGIMASGEARGATVADVRKSFDRRAQIDDITVIGSADLEITKEGGDIVIAFAYPKKVPLFGNISLLIEFSGSSNR